MPPRIRAHRHGEFRCPFCPDAISCLPLAVPPPPQPPRRVSPSRRPRLLPHPQQLPPPQHPPARSSCRRLPYPTNALEPHIDAKTMELHNTRHHQAFITNLNNFAKDNPMIGEKPVTEVLGNLASVPEAIRTGVRNNLGGHANHSMFWQIMGPNGGKPEGEVLAAIDQAISAAWRNS